jgi:PKD domain/Ig-like domain CHU_C associated
MKKTNQYSQYIVALLLALFLSAASNKLIAQSCNQVEILHTSPDCFDKEHSADPGGSQGRDCKPIAVCKDQPYTYTSSIVLPGWTYNWSATGPSTVTINPNTTSSSVSIVWPQLGAYTLTLTATDPSGNVFTYCLTVNVKDKPVANFTFTPNNVCAGSTISFTNTTTFSGGGVAYSWNFGDPASGSNNYSTATNPTHIYNAAGTYTVTLIAYSFTTVSTPGPNGEQQPAIKTCCADTITKRVTITPGTLKIECVSTVCAGDTATYNVVGCPSVTWLPPTGGTILNQTATTVTIIWGNGTPQGQVQAQCPGGCIASVPVPIIPTNPVIVGNTSPCNTSTTSYTLPVLPGTFYTWTLTNTTTNTNHNNLLNTYPDNNTVWINWAAAPPGTYQLTINLDNKHICCNSTGSLIIKPSDKWQAFFDQTICKGAAASLSVSPGAGTFSWTVLPPNTGVAPLTGSGNTFNPSFANAGTYTVQVIETANTYCNSGATNPQQVKIKVINTPAPGTILGSNTACINSNNNYTMSTPAPAGYHYEWSITGGTGTFQPGNPPQPVNGNSASIQWTSLTGTISVVLAANGFPPCPSPAVTLNVTQATVGSITGTMNTCVDGTGTYTLTGGTLPPGETVTWSLAAPYASQGTIILGQGTSNITILWHGNTGAGPWGPITLNATTSCGNAIALTGIMVYPKFSIGVTKTGTDVCLPGGITLTATGAPSGSTYLWSPGGQTTPSITITTEPTSYPATYSVTATKGGCSFTKTYTVEDPFIIRGLTCGVGTCNGTATNEALGVQVIRPTTGTFTYQWYNGTYPSGTAIPGANTANYTTPSHGNYYVVVTYGSCTRYLNFTVKKVCCPDVNNPQITSVVRNSCNSFTFTGTTPNPTGAAITWNFGNGVTMPGTSGVPITYVYPPNTIPGDYCVTFCVGPPSPNPTNCTGNCVSRTVRVPLLAAFNVKLGCNGCVVIENLSQVLPTSGAAVATYNWNFGDGSPVVSTTSATPPTHCYTNTSPTTFTITLNITYSDPSLGLTCSSADTKTVTYAPLAIQVNPSPVCTGVQTNFSLVGSPSFTIITSAWNFGDGFTAYTIPTSHIYNTAGAGIPVTLTVTDALGNTCNANTSINVLPGITSCTIQPGYICPGGSATLTAPNIAGATYLWEVETTPGNFVSAPGTNNAITYSTTVPGFYRVIVTGSNGCKCFSNKVEVKTVTKPKAIIAVSPSSKLCGPGNVFLTSTNHLTGYTSDWYANGNYGTLLSSGQMYFTNVPATTVYNLILTNEYGCKDTCSLQVVVNPIPPPPVITSSPTLCEGVPIILTVTNYAGNITWNTGANTTSITVYAAGVYTATYTHPVTGCTSSKSIKVNRRPPTDLFPHYCDKIPCTCRDSAGNFTIYAPKPLIGAFASNYQIQWYFNGNPVGTNGNNPLYTPAVNGTYHIVVTDPITGCKDTSNTYSIVVLPCDTCDCKESKWGDIILTKGEVHPTPAAKTGNPKNVPIGNGEKLECKGVYTLKCNQTYTINANYICKDTACPPKVTYSLQPPTGGPITGNAPFSFTPNQTGTYTLMMYGWCGNKICDSCKIIFRVDCGNKDCDCKGSKWGEKTYTIDEATKPFNCMKPNDKPIDVKCNKPITINANYICPDPNNCPPKVTYSLQPPTGSPTTGTVPLTFTPNQTGTYSVTLYGWCGNKICDSCVIRFKTICDSVKPCCPYEIKADTTPVKYDYVQIPNATVVTQNFSISGLGTASITEVRANVVSYTITDNFGKECMKCVNLPFTWASVSSATNVLTIPPTITMFGSTVPSFNGSGAGAYQNPREVVWNNGTTISIPNNTNIGMSFILPPPSGIDCCELKGKICVKFISRDKDCKECEVIKCFEFVIKKK